MTTIQPAALDLGPWPFVVTALVGVAVVAVVVLLALRARRRS